MESNIVVSIFSQVGINWPEYLDIKKNINYLNNLKDYIFTYFTYNVYMIGSPYPRVDRIFFGPTYPGCWRKK